MIINVLFVVLMCIASITDYKTKEIYFSNILGLLILGVVRIAIYYRGNATDFLLLLPGIFIVILSKVMGEAIGDGDGFLLLAMGMMLDVRGYTYCIIICLAILFLISSARLITHKFAGKDTIPMAPIFTLGTMVGMII